MESENKNFKALAELIYPNTVESEQNPFYFQELLKKVQVTSTAVKKVNLFILSF